MDFLNSDSIAARVNKVIKQRTAEAQKEHDEECAKIDLDAKARKEAHAQQMVDKILTR